MSISSFQVWKLKNQWEVYVHCTHLLSKMNCLNIITEVVFNTIANDMKMCSWYSIIIDETSVTNRLSYAAIYLRFIMEVRFPLDFIQYVLLKELCSELAENVFGKLKLKNDKVVGEWFDGSVSKSNIHKGLTIRMKDFWVWPHSCKGKA